MKDANELAHEAAEALAASEEEDRGHGSAPWKTQLRKACSFLATAHGVADGAAGAEARTSIVELSLSAVERTLQAVLMKKHEYAPEDFLRHGFAIEEAATRRIIGEELARTLAGIWTEHRNENYYRSAVPSERASIAVLSMAQRVHDDQVQRRSEYRGSCSCPERRER